MIEPVINKELQPDRLKKDLLNISTLIRYGVQIVTHIGDSGEKNLKVLNKRLTRDENNNYIFLLELQNTGERWLLPRISLELYNETGILVKKITGEKVRLYPETSVSYRINLGDITEDKYQAFVLINNEIDSIWGGVYNLNINSGSMDSL